MEVLLKGVDSSGKVKTYGTFKVVGGKVTSTPKKLLQRMEGEPIRNVLEKKYDQILTPADGTKFLKNLKFHFKKRLFVGC